MWDWLPEWDTTEWALVVSTVFTAAAATAAWLSARASLSAIRGARVPFVSGGVLYGINTGRLSLSFANAGPALAVQVVYFAVGPGWKAGGTVGDGHLAAGDKVTIELPYFGGRDEDVYLVWGWRDLDDNIYQRRDDWKTKRISRRGYLRQKDHTLGGMFHSMYPDVAIPEKPTLERGSPRRGRRRGSGVSTE